MLATVDCIHPGLSAGRASAEGVHIGAAIGGGVGQRRTGATVAGADALRGLRNAEVVSAVRVGSAAIEHVIIGSSVDE